jgi:hypothetical protein
VGFPKVLSRISLSWSNKLRGRDVLKDLGVLKRNRCMYMGWGHTIQRCTATFNDLISKIEYVGVHCVDVLSIVGLL